MMPAATAQPVATLRQLGTALEAAITVCLGDPKKKAVHELRRETRRIEAQLDLLQHLRNLPPFRKEAAKLLPQLKRLRRAAGEVRDLDVQRDLIADLAKQLQQAPTETKQRNEIKDEAARLRKDLKHQRRRAEQKLLKVLEKRQRKTAASLERLLEVLEPIADQTLPATDLQRKVEESFHKSCRRAASAADETERLHSVRKAAKVARYQAESASGSKPADRAASRYQRVQSAGGGWHDWLQLTAFARKTLGKHHAFAEHAAARCTREDHAYRTLLRQTDLLGNSR